MEKRKENGKENGKRKGKNGKEKGKRKKKKKGKEREREKGRLAPALIAATTAGPVGHAQRSPARADEATGKGVGGWKLDVWNRERFRELGFRVLGGF